MVWCCLKCLLSLIWCPHLFLTVKSLFLVSILPRVCSLWLGVFLAIFILFRTYLLGWTNFLLDLSSTFLLGILELKRDASVIIFPPENMLCLQMSHSLRLFQIFSHIVLLLPLKLFSSIACAIACACFWRFLARSTSRYFDATCIKISSRFQICLHPSPKGSCLWTSSSWILSCWRSYSSTINISIWLWYPNCPS